MNNLVLMSGAKYFGDDDAINELMDASIPVNVELAQAEHDLICKTLEESGVEVRKIPSPDGLQDGVYTANWALIKDGKALMARLPNTRQPEEAFALQAVKDLGLQPIILPEQVARFSGQGDALICGDVVFTQSPYRTTVEAHPYLKSELRIAEVIALETLPAYDEDGLPKINAVTQLPDSPTYDIDLAIAILKMPAEGQKGLIAYCPEVFNESSQVIMEAYDGVDKIKVSKQEALEAFALNLLSTGEVVIMNSGAPVFQAELEARGLVVKPLDLPELRKGGGSIRCSTLTLDG